MKSWFIGLTLGMCSLGCLAGNAGDYQLGGGDVLKVSVYDNPDLDTEAMLSATGDLNLPLLGRVHLAGLTLDQAESRVADDFQTEGYVKHAQVTLVVSQYRSQKVSVIGEFNHPGVILLDQPTDLFGVIAQAGGIAANGGDQVVVIHDQARATYSIKQLTHQNQTNTVMIVGGDVVIAPRDLVFVSGEVNHPGGFRLEADMTVMQAIAVAGGFTDKASKDALTIHRSLGPGREQTIEARSTDPLREGDVVEVAQSWF